MTRHPVETLWREVGLPEYFLGNGGTNAHLYALYDAIVEQCAMAAEAQDRAGYEWVGDSLWANILRRAGANVRRLKRRSPANPSQNGNTHDA